MAGRVRSVERSTQHGHALVLQSPIRIAGGRKRPSRDRRRAHPRPRGRRAKLAPRPAPRPARAAVMNDVKPPSTTPRPFLRRRRQPQGGDIGPTHFAHDHGRPGFHRGHLPDGVSSGRSSRTTPTTSLRRRENASICFPNGGANGSGERGRTHDLVPNLGSSAATISGPSKLRPRSTSSTTNPLRIWPDERLAGTACSPAGRLVESTQRPAAGPRPADPGHDLVHRAQPRLRRHLHLLAGGPARDRARGTARCGAGRPRARRGHHLPRLRRPAGRGAGERPTRGDAGARCRGRPRAARHGPRHRGPPPRHLGPAPPAAPTASTSRRRLCPPGQVAAGPLRRR